MFVGLGIPSCQTGICFQKVELQKADAAWKRTAEVSMEQTEEETEAQVTRYVPQCLTVLLYFKATSSPVLALPEGMLGTP